MLTRDKMKALNMSGESEPILPTLEEFELPGAVFKVVDPSSLPGNVLKAFNEFMTGASVPHRVYVYSHDYSRFCMLVKRGSIIVD